MLIYKIILKSLTRYPTLEIWVCYKNSRHDLFVWFLNCRTFFWNFKYKKILIPVFNDCFVFLKFCFECTLNFKIFF